MEKVLLGMSGGVDSSLSALKLKQQGFEVIGYTMNLCKYSQSAVSDAKKVASSLGIEHFVLDLREPFNKHVIKYFTNEYANGRTPNPCVECNKYLKFGLLYEKAKQIGAKYIATGHYAKVEYDPNYGKNVLKKADNLKKDQSYFLYTIKQEVLDHVMFPLQNFESKDDVRTQAQDNGLFVAHKKDSEDICFIPDGDYKKFLLENGQKEKQGNIVNTKGKILANHNGIFNYTIGQRKGLGISYTEPLFVIGFNKTKNEVIVGTKEELYKNEFIVEKPNFLLIDDLNEKINVNVKTRYSQKEYSATIEKINDSEVKVNLLDNYCAIASGQSAVFYVDDIVLGGGIIK